MQSAARKVAQTSFAAQKRRMTTAMPFKGQADGGHPVVLQKEPPFVKTWMNAKASPEILPIGFIVVFACGLASYKMFVVDTFKKPFVERLPHKK